jgi:hypothetical protein
MEEQKAIDDTGIHIAMRILLSIVAGLLVSDLLKAWVKTIVVIRRHVAPVSLTRWSFSVRWLLSYALSSTTYCITTRSIRWLERRHIGAG